MRLVSRPCRRRRPSSRDDGGPEDLSDPGVEPRSPVLWVDSLPLSYEGSPHRHAETQLRLNWVSYILCGHARMLDTGFES